MLFAAGALPQTLLGELIRCLRVNLTSQTWLHVKYNKNNPKTIVKRSRIVSVICFRFISHLTTSEITLKIVLFQFYFSFISDVTTALPAKTLVRFIRFNWCLCSYNICRTKLVTYSLLCMACAFCLVCQRRNSWHWILI